MYSVKSCEYFADVVIRVLLCLCFIAIYEVLYLLADQFVLCIFAQLFILHLMIIMLVIHRYITEIKMLSFWWNFCHLLHWKLSFYITEMKMSFWWNFRHWLHWKFSFDNFQCSQWRKFHQNGDIFVSMMLCNMFWTSVKLLNNSGWFQLSPEWVPTCF